MKHGNEAPVGIAVPLDPSLGTLLARLEKLSLEPRFSSQRQIALERALRPYLESSGDVLRPLPEEIHLATLAMYADFYPEDGQLTLIEQLRDVITEHIPDEERRWLDPLKHSYMDLLEVLPVGTGEPMQVVSLRSIGDGTHVRVQGGKYGRGLVAGEVLLTRVVRDPGDPEQGIGRIAGSALSLSMKKARAVLEASREWERSMEIASGSFVLGEWQEFIKRYGHLLLWNFAYLRLATILDAVVHIRYRTAEGAPYLYGLALYDHLEYGFLVDGLSAMKEFEENPPPANQPAQKDKPVRVWIQRASGYDGAETVVARLTLTSVQLIVECDSPDRLNAVKHQLASTFGYSLHFRGESLTPPARELPEDQLTKGESPLFVVTAEEDRALIRNFLEEAYLEWSDQPLAALGGQTPRHAAAQPASRAQVEKLIDEMARHDLGMLRLGNLVFDYDVLRAHVGLL